MESGHILNEAMSAGTAAALMCRVAMAAPDARVGMQHIFERGVVEAVLLRDVIESVNGHDFEIEPNIAHVFDEFSLAAGDDRLVWCDGQDIHYASTDRLGFFGITKDIA